MNELSLFSGVGGGLLATQQILRWRTVGYVEIDPYCQEVLEARIRDGLLHEAPIFGDINGFVESGAAREYRGFADVVTAGFPCQPFSVAGKREGEDDKRNLWPQTVECLRLVRPRFALLENVPGLLAHGYFGRILGELAEIGYDAIWDCVPASAVGAPHQRDRLWILARRISDSECDTVRELAERRQGATQEAEPWNAESRNDGAEEPVAESDARRSRSERPRTEERQWPESSWWLSEPDVGRVAHGVASRVDRLKALGNGQVPAVVAAVWRLLIGEA